MSLYFAGLLVGLGVGLFVGWAIGAYQLDRTHAKLDHKHSSAVQEEDLKQTLDRSFELGKIAGRMELIHEQQQRRLSEASEASEN